MFVRHIQIVSFTASHFFSLLLDSSPPLGCVKPTNPSTIPKCPQLFLSRFFFLKGRGALGSERQVMTSSWHFSPVDTENFVTASAQTQQAACGTYPDTSCIHDGPLPNLAMGNCETPISGGYKTQNIFIWISISILYCFLLRMVVIFILFNYLWKYLFFSFVQS